MAFRAQYPVRGDRDRNIPERQPPWPSPSARSSPQQAHLVPGYRLDGRYELLYPYAQGGMATVWLARVQGKHGFEKLVAVKTILPHLASDKGFRDMFLDEASIASRIRHPNVADIVDLGEEGDTLYMVLEWVNGDSWSKLYGAVQAAGHAVPDPPLAPHRRRRLRRPPRRARAARRRRAPSSTWSTATSRRRTCSSPSAA